MAEILRNNFDTLLPVLLDSIRNADFIVIDTNVEVTGFTWIEEEFNVAALRDKGKGKGWYSAVRSSQRTVSPLDFGLATFKMEGDGSFFVKAFQVPMLQAYVDEHDARQPSRDWRVAEERLDIPIPGREFLEFVNFDLNKVLYQGTPFLNKEGREKAEAYMREHPDFMAIGLDPNIIYIINGPLDRSYFPTFKEKVEEADIKEILDRLRGIAKVFDVMKEVQVPVIGHQVLLKFVYLYKDFVEFLPEEWPDCRKKIEEIIPRFFDTKYICEKMKMKNPNVNASSNSFLYQLYRNLYADVKIPEPTIKLDEDSAVEYELVLDELKTLTVEMEEEEDTFCFESGFDAVVSGIVFIKLMTLEYGKFDLKEFSKYKEDFGNKTLLPQGDVFPIPYLKYKPRKP